MGGGEDRKVKMYVCGPTVYDFLHIGNFRGAIFFNLLRSWLEHHGYQVTFLYNYTDVDDKIINRASQEGVSAAEISAKYIREFEADFKALKLRPHDGNPQVTQYMPDIVRFIERLLEKGKAYVRDGEVIYSIEAFPAYRKPNGKKLDYLEAGSRVEVDAKKQNPLDFVLWKPSKAGEPAWESPWGKGRPGWHIECSTMAISLLGEEIDIHGGGVDLIFPHHENEIAQAEGATGRPYVRYWMHNNFVKFNDDKMSKSKGNVVPARVFLEQYGGEVLKYMVLSVHYRSLLNFSESQIFQAMAGLARVYQAVRGAREIAAHKEVAGKADSEFEAAVRAAGQKSEEALDDDLNTPVIFAQIFDIVRLWNACYKNAKKITAGIKGNAEVFLAWIDNIARITALFGEPEAAYLRFLDDILLKEKKLERAGVDRLVKEREDARAAKDFKRADALRAELDAMGIDIQDSPQGTFWEVRKSDLC